MITDATFNVDELILISVDDHIAEMGPGCFDARERVRDMSAPAGTSPR